MVELVDIHLQFSNQTLFKELNLSVQTGERLVLVGPSGAGKSACLKLIGGILAPTQGEVRTLGTKGMLFQKNALFDSLSALENVTFPILETTEISVKQARDQALELLNAVGLLESQNSFPDEMSGGMQKRLGLARALALRPQILLCDDPTAGLDPITSKKIIELIIHVQEKWNTTLVVVTNDMNRAYQVAHRIAVFKDQGLVVTGTAQETQNFQDPIIQSFLRGNLDDS